MKNVDKLIEHASFAMAGLTTLLWLLFFIAKRTCVRERGML